MLKYQRKLPGEDWLHFILYQQIVLPVATSESKIFLTNIYYEQEVCSFSPTQTERKNRGTKVMKQIVKTSEEFVNNWENRKKSHL